METGKYAIWYARRGLAVFPLATVDDGRCSCGKERCSSPGKHPLSDLAPHGCLDATTNETTIAQWWALFPDANIGIATGSISDIVVVDVDDDHGGWITMENLSARNEELPTTWMAATGGGGGHLYFVMPAVDLRNSAAMIGPGVDVRGEGGYVVAPPSTHVSGKQYQWAAHPKETDLAEMPDWLIRRCVPQSVFGRNPHAMALPHELSEGMRNSWLASAAGTMRRRGFSADAINAALQVENRQRCTPPLDTREVERIARSIERYPPAATIAVGNQRFSA